MVLAEALAGIALVKGAVDGIKTAINTANDVSDIAHQIDALFEGRDQIQKDRQKAANDPFSLKSVAQETINAKLAEEHFDEMRQLIDYRFGFGTWQSIVAERARRIQEAKEAERKAKRAQILKQEKYQEIGLASMLIIMIIAGLGFIGWLMWKRNNGG